jgi:LysM domain-containing protein
MSTLSISRTPESSDVDARFDARVRYVPAQRTPETDFETVFDLDYGQPIDAPVAPVMKLRPQPKPAKVAPRAVRLTRRGRIVLVMGFLAIAMALMIPFGGWAAASLTGGTPEPVRVVEVQPGDTLYGIAGDLAQPGHIREMVHRIQELNSLPGGLITEGQKLAVPRG